MIFKKFKEYEFTTNLVKSKKKNLKNLMISFQKKKLIIYYL